jgi:hypothetical protein
MGIQKHRSRNKGNLTFAAKVTITLAVSIGCLFALWLMAWGYMLVRVKADGTASSVSDKVAGASAKYLGEKRSTTTAV